MSRLEPMLKIDLETLLEHGRVVPPLRDAVRTRAMARARATAATVFLVPSPIQVPRGRVPWGGLMPAAIVGIGAAGALFAWNERGTRHSESNSPAVNVEASPSPPAPLSPVAPQAPLPSSSAERTLPPAPSTGAVTTKRAVQAGAPPRLLRGRARAPSTRARRLREPGIYGGAARFSGTCASVPERAPRRRARGLARTLARRRWP